jgi:hypothetical protein
LFVAVAKENDLRRDKFAAQIIPFRQRKRLPPKMGNFSGMAVAIYQWSQRDILREIAKDHFGWANWC